MLAIFSLLGSSIALGSSGPLRRRVSTGRAGRLPSSALAGVTFHSMVHRWSSGRTARASPARDSDVSRRSRQGILSR